MKISIGINGYKPFSCLEKREKFCIESLLRLKKKHDNITLYNVCYESDEDVNYEGLTTLCQLEKKSCKIIKEYFQHEGLQKEYTLKQNQIDSNTTSIPSVKELFDVLAATDCDYFMFLNNDIILSDRFINAMTEDIECYPMSRMHIYDIDSLDDIPKLESYSVHGFDAFLIKKETWLKIRNNFEDLILGRSHWDLYFFSMFNLLCKCKTLNKLPPVCFHIEHNSTSCSDSIENYYNEDVFKRNQVLGHLWFSYVYNVLLTRPTVNDCKWFQPIPNEEYVEQQYYNQFNQPIIVNENFKKEEITYKQDYDLFIPVAPKDEIKLRHVIEYANKNLKHKNIYVCSPHDITNKITDTNIQYINDRDVLDIPDKSFISFRPNWTYQQFLKLFFSFSNSEYYFALDADTIITKPLSLFEGNKPIWYYGWKQNHFPYFLFNKKFFNLDKTLSHTGIGDLGLFNKNIVKTFLNYTGQNSGKELLQKIGNKTNAVFHFSEYETYANFANKYFEDLYIFKHIDQQNCGRDLDRGQQWTNEDIEATIKQHESNTILSLHSWLL